MSGVITSRNTLTPLPPSELGDAKRQYKWSKILTPLISLISGESRTRLWAERMSISPLETLSLAIVKMLHSTGNFKVLSRPTVFTTNNKKAIIASGQEIPVPVNTIAGGINGGLAQQSNIQYKKIALQLEVVPLINSEKEVTLEILQKLDSVAGFTQLENNNIPTIATKCHQDHCFAA